MLIVCHRADEEVMMSRLRWVLCSVVLAFGACAVSTGVDPGEAVSTSSDMQEVQAVSTALSPAETGVTCTETLGVCAAVPKCESIPDTRQFLTETCCTASGSCTTERYAICGC